MTMYEPDDLDNGWEFKIVRANRAVFSKPATLNRLLAEEERAGWTMIEKFDDTRIRFKRPRQARLNDANLPHGVDPYRCQFGLSAGAYVGLLMLVMFGAVTLIMAILAHALR